MAKKRKKYTLRDPLSGVIIEVNGEKALKDILDKKFGKRLLPTKKKKVGKKRR